MILSSASLSSIMRSPPIGIACISRSPCPIDFSVSTHTSIGIAVADDARAAGALAAEGADAVRAQRARQEAVQRRTDVREALRAIDLQQAGGLVDLVLDRVGRHDLDVRGDDLRRLGAELDAVPGMRAESGGKIVGMLSVTLSGDEEYWARNDRPQVLHPQRSGLSPARNPVSRHLPAAAAGVRRDHRGAQRAARRAANGRRSMPSRASSRAASSSLPRWRCGMARASCSSARRASCRRR